MAPDDKFCIQCGTRVSAPPVQAAPAPTPPATVPVPFQDLGVPQSDQTSKPAPYAPPPWHGADTPPPPPPGRRNPNLPLIATGVVAVVVIAGLVVWLFVGRSPSSPAVAIPVIESPAAPAPVDPTPEPSEPATTPDDPVPTTAPATGSADGLVSVDPQVSSDVSADVVNSVTQVFDQYFSGVNSHAFKAAYAQFSPREKAKNPYATWVKNIGRSSNTKILIEGLGGSDQAVGDGDVSAQVSFRSRQSADKGVNKGETCTDWSLTYTLTPDDAATGYLIDSARATSGTGHSAC